METKHPPSFTVSLRGYDREEVDHDLDSLAEALRNVEDAEERNRRLQTQVVRLSGRVKDLEERIRSDTPKTGAVLGERISIMLSMAEETAAETINRAEVKASETSGAAQQKLSEAEAELRSAVSRGEEQGRRIEAEARTTAAEIVAESEARAAARTRQIEQWAEDVVTRTRAEDARLVKEQQVRRDAATAELESLTAQRNQVTATLAQLRDSIGRSIGVEGDLETEPSDPTTPPSDSLTSSPAADAPAAPGTGEHEVGAPSTTGEDAVADATADPAGAGAEVGDDTPTGDQSVSESQPLSEQQPSSDGTTSQGSAATASGWHPAVVFGATVPSDEGSEPELADSDAPQPGPNTSTVMGDEFDAKLEAWVSEGARHFRRD
jgi:cell division septum initiation protein DivIVA